MASQGWPLPFIKAQFFDNNGNPASSHKLFSYEAGTTTKTNTWSDYALSSANANPIVLDSAGRASIFLSQTQLYKFVLATSSDSDPPASPIWTVDNIGAQDATASVRGFVSIADQNLAGTKRTTGGWHSSSATAGIGYITGAGGTVTQATNKATGVTLNKICGQITMNNAVLGTGAEVTFVLTNSTIGEKDAVFVQHSSVGTSGVYFCSASNIQNGSCDITVSNVGAGSPGEAIVLTFFVFKAVSA